MFLEIYKDTKELGDAEARRIAALLKKKPDALLCLAAGQSAICVLNFLSWTLKGRGSGFQQNTDRRTGRMV